MKKFLSFEEMLPQRGLILMFTENNSEIKEFDVDSKKIVIASEMREVDPRFFGHFDILPGAYQLEMVAQGGILAIKNLQPDIEGLPVLSTIEKGEFKRPITPGGTFFTEVSLQREVIVMGGEAKQYLFEGAIKNEKGKICSRIVFTGMKYAGRKE